MSTADAPQTTPAPQGKGVEQSTNPHTPGCCGGLPRFDAAACCALDETRKASGEAGCGCRTADEPEVPAAKAPSRRDSCCR